MIRRFIGRKKKKKNAGLKKDEIVMDKAKSTLDENAASPGPSREAPDLRPFILSAVISGIDDDEQAGPSGECRRRIGELEEVAGPSLPRLENVQQEEEFPQGDVNSAERTQHELSSNQLSEEEMRDLENKLDETLKQLAHVYAVCRSQGKKYPPLKICLSKDSKRCKSFINRGMADLDEIQYLLVQQSTLTPEEEEKCSSYLERALISFTNAVAYAPQDSEELTLAYYYRARILMNTHDFVDALVDLYRCATPNIPTKVIMKMKLLRAECIQRLELETPEQMSASAAEEETPTRINPLRRRRRLLARAGVSTYKGVKKLVKRMSIKSRSSSNLARGLDNLSPDGGLNELDIDYNRDEDTIKKVDGNAIDGTVSKNKLFSVSSNVSLKCESIIRRRKKYLCAGGNIKPGELLISALAYVSMLDVKYFKSHCSHCSLRSRNLFPCHNCSLVMYCCNGCRKSAWTKYHKLECQYLFHMIAAKRPHNEILALRILMILTKQGELLDIPKMKIPNQPAQPGFNQMKDVVNSKHYETILNIVIPFDEIDIRVQYDYCSATLYLLQMLKQTTYFSHVLDKVPAYSPTLLDKKMTKKEALAALLLNKCLWVARFSSHSIIGSKNQVCAAAEQLKLSRQVRVGDAVYPIFTWKVLRHSCRPNVTIVNFKDKAYLYSTKPIQSGTELTYSFGGPYYTIDKNIRIDAIRNRYHKTASWCCKCKACQENWKCEPELPKYFPTYSSTNWKIFWRRDFFELRTTKILFRELWKEQKEKNVLQRRIMGVYRYSELLHSFVKEEFRDFARCQKLIEHYLNFKMDRELIVFLIEVENETIFQFTSKEETQH